MYAVIQIGSTQYMVREKEEFLVDHLDMEEGKNIKIDHVLLYADDEAQKVMIGTPYLDHVKVEARVLGHEKGEKLRVFKMKAKKRYQKTQGHRSHYTRLKVLKISVLSGSAKAEQEEGVEKAETPKVTPKKAVAPKKKTEKQEE
ncbi:MAG: hypothetical protein ACD_28C00269G0001 [uncultured bacterium]|nr:MAG: hypothetical protein ACD_28C00269G0001 [uncultured bacterium]KKT75817.1 MAG: Ribosomal protein L21 [Candidatus Peregrinibacteria bacterium GW2011_GWA2_44_7]